MSKPSKLENQEILLGEDYIEVWVESFLTAKKAENLAKGTITFYKERLVSFVSFLEGQAVRYIFQITPQVIRDYLLYLEEVKEHNSGGVHSYYRVIKTFLRWFWEEVDLTSINPISKVKAPKLPVEPIEGISKEEFDSMLSQCKRGTYYGERDRAILLTLLDTGVRANELCQMNLEDVNLMDSSILIRQGKGRKPRFVFFGKTTRKQLRKWITLRGLEGNALFNSRQGERVKYSTLREVMRRLSFKAGVKEPSLHDFRRAFCLECLNRGMSEISIARIMGHTTTGLIGRYAKQKKGDLAVAYKGVVDEE